MPWRGPQVEGERPTLGWVVIDWIEEHCVVPSGVYAGEKFRLTHHDTGLPTWQGEFVLGLYELKSDAVVDELKPSRAWTYDRGGQLVAPQKSGKGPLVSAIICAEAYGPVLFDGWDASGEPVGRSWPTPWIQVTAHSEDQTANVWRALIPMIELSQLAHEIPDTGKTRINLPNRGLIEPVTAAARSRLGQPVTFVSQDEVQSWNKRNGGILLADTQRRNLAGMGGRFVAFGNAWDPSEDSVAQLTWEKETGVYKVMLRGGSGSIRNRRDRERILKQVYADSWWIDWERINSEIESLLEKGELAQAERFFFNRLVPSEDRAFDAKRWRELARPGTTISNGEKITIGVDGARYVDALAVVATDIKTGFQWPLGIWTRPLSAPDDYEHPMDEVDGVVIDAFELYDVWRVYIDPGSQYANIAPLMEKWQGRWGDKKIVGWLMSRPRPTANMVRNYVSAIMTGDLTHDGDELMEEHVRNARRKMVTVYDEDGHAMFVLQKEAPNSPNKIDAAAAGALSWEARGDAIADGMTAYSGYDDPANKCARCGHLRRHHVDTGCRGRPPGHCDEFVEPQ
jgi:hypothetical protein